MKKFPCYNCPRIGEEAPRCNDWKKCRSYRGWLRSQGIKGLVIYVAGLIVEHRKAKQAGEVKQDG